jgi:hypothetical protein
MWTEFLLTVLVLLTFVVGVLVLMQIQNQQQKQRPVEVVIRRPFGPYYSHLPVRPLLY